MGHVSEETYIRLSELIEAINERFGLDLTEADALFFEQVGQDMLTDDKLWPLRQKRLRRITSRSPSRTPS